MMTPRTLIPALVLGWLVSLAIAPLHAAESKPSRFNALLVWGTNGPKPADRDYKPISPELSKSLGRIFKWKNYFEINRKAFTASSDKPARVEMSRECRLEVAHLDKDEFEIRLYGKGVLVVTKRQRITPGETVVLGGDDKNDDAWFVVLTLARP